MTPNSVFSALRSGWCDWADYLSNPNFVRAGDCVTWHGNRRFKPKGLLGAKTIYELEATRQFSFQVSEDGALLQLHYQFDAAERLVGATLGYYGVSLQVPCLPLVSVASEVPASSGDLSTTDGVDDESETSGEAETAGVDSSQAEPEEIAVWLRVDFAPGAKLRGLLHYDCHLHVSHWPLSRLPIMGVPGPRQFFEMIFAWFYPDIYRKHRSLTVDGFQDGGDGTDAVNEVCHRLAEPRIRTGAAHMAWPVAVAEVPEARKMLAK